jgi:DHA3 family macrolide efflux protein-like MFS transporter
MQSKSGRAFTFYLAGQGISNLGDSFRFIAVTILIFKLTGSGMEAAIGLAFSTLPSILASPFAGVLGDRINERRLLVLIDFVRFLTVPTFLLVNNVTHIYLLLIILSLFDLFYSPSRRKFVLGMTGREGALNANSLLTGVSGAAYLVGPLTAGFITDACGTAPAIIAASFCCLCSCFMTLAAGAIYAKASAKGRCGNVKRTAHSGAAEREKHTLAAELGKGFRYCISAPDVRTLLLIGLVTGFCTISVNLSFYPYAFDVLKVTARGWSMMITVYYGTNLLAMLFLKYLGAHLKKHDGRLFYSGLCIVSVIWAFYAIVTNFAGVLLLQFTEGTVIAVCGILLAARFQTITQKSFMARVAGANDIISNIGKIAGMGCTILITGCFTFRIVFILNSTLLFLFSFSGLICTHWGRNSSAKTGEIRISRS